MITKIGKITAAKADTMSAYQTYYILKKLDFATWKRRVMPEWINAKRGVLGLHGSQVA